MQKPEAPIPEHLAREIWLSYFNDYLLERGVITQERWRQMRRLIATGTNKKST